MSRFWVNLALEVCNCVGLCPSLATDHEEVNALLKRLHPYKTLKPLIRVGAERDGGYLLPDDLEGITALFSPGVCTCSSFELACAERCMQVFMADRSVDGPAAEHPNFHFLKRFLGAGGEYITLDDWVKESLPPNDHSDLMLQMDIEGYEYETLLAASRETLSRFRIMVIEFHRLPDMFSKPGFRLFEPAFRKLLDTHVVCHHHPNNAGAVYRRNGVEMYQVIEMTWIRRDRAIVSKFATDFPNPLDVDNVADRPRLGLSDCWFRGKTI